MSIRNDLMGGSDWIASEILTHDDLNDTFNYAGSMLKTNPAFWINDSLYTVYDNFDDYAAGSMTVSIGSLWNSSGTMTISSTTYAGGTSQEMLIESGTWLATASLLSNRHTHMKIYHNVSDSASSGNATISSQISIGSNDYISVFTAYGRDGYISGAAYADVMRIAKGGNIYDLYVGGKKIISDFIGSDDAQIYLKTATTGDPYNTKMYIDDVRESTIDII